MSLRIDRWLWQTRFFKTRGKAAVAVKGGLVHVNGERVKVSRIVRSDDVIKVTRGTERITVTVLGMPERRGSAAEVAAFYQLDEVVDERITASIGRAPEAFVSRPDKKGRRQLRRLKGRS
ncbi:MAG: S4 domain-containing protein [Gammaproteobacteria bacterium]|nr:S4 domain-containing protein [Gammaproteobacteria bacterium]